jgi:hypothetical protein
MERDPRCQKTWDPGPRRNRSTPGSNASKVAASMLELFPYSILQRVPATSLREGEKSTQVASAAQR